MLSYIEMKSGFLHVLPLGAAKGGGARGQVAGGAQVRGVACETGEAVLLVNQKEVEDHLEIFRAVVGRLRLVHGNNMNGIVLLCRGKQQTHQKIMNCPFHLIITLLLLYHPRNGQLTSTLHVQSGVLACPWMQWGITFFCFKVNTSALHGG